ncbi:trypsin-1-like [Cimex lectularius]|uniref:Peptidase S1 domain-containing protein n=1 Tax=Cimex lectularius TaxID=79782 RepID=A0A8I6RVA6_CIMLE|nr:trypsin-1-like [Cimex lectularius]
MRSPLPVAVALIVLTIHVSGKNIRSGKSCNCVCGVGDRKQRIIGGKRSEAHEFPWIASLSLNGTFYCGASLLTSRHLLTAAHCLYGKRYTDIRVGLGEHDRDQKNEPGKRLLKLKRATMHEGFSVVKIQHDIGIIELETPVEHNGPFIRTACLPTTVNANYSGLDGIVAGWGKQKENGPTTPILRKVTIPLLTREECATGYGYCPKKILETNFCAGQPGGMKDACQGDSGGPIHLNHTAPNHMELIGIVSWGRGCGRPNYPGVYTRVDKYTSWIQKQIGDECTCTPPAN